MSEAVAPSWQMPHDPNRTPLAGNGEFMLAGWGEVEPVLAPENPVLAFTAERRDRVASIFPGERLVIPCGAPRVRSNDTDYLFRPGTDHVWLTGNTVAESVLVIDATGGTASSTLFVRPGSGRDSDEFWQSAAYGDLWVGARPSLAELEQQLGLECRPLGELEGALAGSQATRVVPTLDESVDALVRSNHGADFAPHLALKAALDDVRLVKNAWELGELRLAAEVTVRGFEDCVREWQLARRFGERWVEGTFNRRARLEGEGTAYTTIVAGGKHATTMHWIENSGPLRDGELVLLDMGAELPSLYSADVTRTLPISGTFGALQRDVYSIVLRAQRAGIATLRAGALFQDYQDACSRSLASDLIDLGLLHCSIDEAMAPEAQYFRRWSITRAGHMLGMDAHDCNHAPTGHYLHGALQAGNVLTVEPGLYFQVEDLTVPAELRGMGIRIEDDLIVEAEGSVNLSAGLPREPGDVEQWMGGLAG